MAIHEFAGLSLHDVGFTHLARAVSERVDANAGRHVTFGTSYPSPSTVAYCTPFVTPFLQAYREHVSNRTRCVLPCRAGHLVSARAAPRFHAYFTSSAVCGARPRVVLQLVLQNIAAMQADSFRWLLVVRRTVLRFRRGSGRGWPGPRSSMSRGKPSTTSSSSPSKTQYRHNIRFL